MRSCSMRSGPSQSPSPTNICAESPSAISLSSRRPAATARDTNPWPISRARPSPPKLRHGHAQFFNEFHALTVAVGKAHCGRTARCAGCPLAADLQFLPKRKAMLKSAG